MAAQGAASETMSNTAPDQIVARLREEMLAGYERLVSIVESPSFQLMLEEMYALPQNERPAFVTSVVLNRVSALAAVLIYRKTC